MTQATRTHLSQRGLGLVLAAGIALGVWIGQAWQPGEARAQSQPRSEFPNSTILRVEMIQELQSIGGKLDTIAALLESGDGRVQIQEAAPPRQAGQGR